MTKLYAAVAPNPFTTECFINYFSTDYDKIYQWATEHYTKSVEIIDELEPGCNSAKDLQENWRIIEIPFEEFFFLQPERFNDIPGLEEANKEYLTYLEKTYPEQDDD